MPNLNDHNHFALARRSMIEHDIKGRGITNPNVLKIMAELAREDFVPSEYKSQAYFDGPLSIGLDQTISQPYIVALMTEELKVKSDMDVLEIGTGSGYQTAVLCRLAKKVYTIERLEQLSQKAQIVLQQSGMDNVEFHVGDGSCGWPEKKSFDRIMITAAVPNIPKPILKQLKQDGLLVAPVGSTGVQKLIVCQKKKEQISKQFICDVRFVKLIGKYGFKQ